MKRTEKLSTVNIKGKEYTEVHTRLQFLAKHFDYEIDTVVDFFPEEKMWTVACKLTIHEENGPRTYMGHAQEIIGEGYINKTSALENAETSAVGRACAMAGIGLIDAIASVDEINKAKNRNSEPVQEQATSENDNKPWLNITDKDKNITPQWSNVSAAIVDGKITSIAQVREHYKVNKAVAKTLEDILTDQAAA